MDATDVRITIQPIDESGRAVGDHNEVTYPLPEDKHELLELGEYLIGDVMDALGDCLTIT